MGLGLNVGSQSVGFERDGNIVIGVSDKSSIEGYSINYSIGKEFQAQRVALVR